MSYGNFRSSTGNLDYYDDPPRRPERWDRDKFERYSNTRRGPDERDAPRFDDRDRFPPSRPYRESDFEDRFERRESRESRAPPRAQLLERDRIYEEERFGRRRPEWLDEPTAAEVANRALAPYRRKSIVEREITLPSRPARPGYHRRQSSLDTYDRRPLPRFDEHERDDWRPPSNVPIPLPIMERRRSPSRVRRPREEEFEEIRYRELEPDHREENYRDIHIHQEKSVRRKSMSRHRARSMAHSSRSSTSSFEEVSPVREVGKKGRTRMPKRLVHKQAVIDLGYPFEEEDDFIVVKRALEKEQIDEVIKISETYKDNKVTYLYEETKEIEAAPPPAPPTVIEIPAPPPPAPVYEPLPPPPAPITVAPPRSVRSASPARTVVEERFQQESNHIHGPVTMLVPHEHHDREYTSFERHTDHRELVPVERRSERELKAEIRALEAERRLIKMERESDYEFVDRREPKREIVRVEKDRKVRRPDSKVLAAMMATLS